MARPADILLRPYRLLRDWNKLRTTDLFLIGYPRSGNTWSKFLLGKYIQLLCGSSEMYLLNEYDLLGRCRKTCLGLAVNVSHGRLNWTRLTEDQVTAQAFVEPYLTKKIILLTRYPMDSLVSNWVYYTHLSRKLTMTLEEFLEHPLHSLTKWIRYHNLWAEARTWISDQPLLIRYEAMRADTLAELRRVVEFAGLELNENFLQQAIEYANIDNMKKMQASGQVPGRTTNGNPVIRVGDRSDPEAAHVRKGEVRGYQKYLDADLALHYEQRIAQELHPLFGYQAPPQRREN